MSKKKQTNRSRGKGTAKGTRFSGTPKQRELKNLVFRILLGGRC